MIDPESWRQLRPFLDRALDLADAERAEYLATVRAERPELATDLDALVQAYEAAGDTALERPAAMLSEDVPRSVGPYQIVQKIGQGGMGEVYLGQRRDDYEQVAAVKLLRGGWTSSAMRQRFRTERQILAQLDHPSIARLLDGGSTDDGRPYLVMEYVSGRPLDEYCRACTLSLHQLLELFLQICSALEYAHRNLVVHRDLKPSNILVTEDGTPKLLDFGIAKILRPEAFPQTVMTTRAGGAAMTPEYASPEQIRGDPVTTATDVYALGILLYRMLTGAPPYRFDSRDLSAMTEAICHAEPTRPSVAARGGDGTGDGATFSAGDVSRRLRGDLDAIVLKALRKEPEQRYPSASHLADDLRRYLSGHAVQARRGTAAYRLAKFVGRHRLAVSFSAATLVLLIAFVGVLLRQQTRILEERDRTLLERNRATEVAGWMTELFQLPDPSRSAGESVSARELLDKGARSIERDVDDPDLKAELMATIGRTYTQLGLLAEGRRQLQAAIDLVRRGGAGDDSLPRYLLHLGEAEISDGNYVQAEKALLEALARARADGAPSDPTVDDPDADDPNREIVVRAHGLHGRVLDLLGRSQQAVEELDRALALARSTDDPELLADTLELAAVAKRRLGDLDQAAAHYQEALEALRAVHGERHADIAGVLGNLAVVEKWRDPELAERLFLEALEMQQQIFGEQHPVVATTWNNLAQLYYEQGRLHEAEESWRRSLDMHRALYGADNHKIALISMNLATVHGRMGDAERAESGLRDALGILRREVGDQHPDTALSLNNLGEYLLSLGRTDDARPYLLESLAVTRASLGEDHWRTASILASLGDLARLEGDSERAAERLRAAISKARQSLGAHHPVLPSAVLKLASVYEYAGDHRAAHDVLVAAEDVWQVKQGHLVEELMAHTQLAGLMHKLDRSEEAATTARETLEGWRRHPGGDRHPWSLVAQRILIRALVDLERYAEAETWALDLLERLPDGQDRRRRRTLEALAEIYDATGRPERAAEARQQIARLPDS